MVADANEEWARADSFYETALGLTTTPAGVLNNWGYSKLTRGDYGGAERLFTDALRHDPDLFTAKNNLVLARGAQRQYDLPVIQMTQIERGPAALHDGADGDQAERRDDRQGPAAGGDRHPPAAFRGSVAGARRARIERHELMATEVEAAAWLLMPALPICLWVAWSDLARMKIPNLAVLALLAGFAVVGALVLPLPDYGWRWLQAAVMLALGIALNAAGAMGAGDAKFIAAAAPFVALGDLPTVLYLLAGLAILSFLLHRLVRVSPLRRLVPHWASWDAGNRFPFGLPLAATLVAYLGLAALAA